MNDSEVDPNLNSSRRESQRKRQLTQKMSKGTMKLIRGGLKKAKQAKGKVSKGLGYHNLRERKLAYLKRHQDREMAKQETV